MRIILENLFRFGDLPEIEATPTFPDVWMLKIIDLKNC